MLKIQQILENNQNKKIRIVLISRFRYEGKILESNEDHVLIHDEKTDSNVYVKIDEIAEFRLEEE